MKILLSVSLLSLLLSCSNDFQESKRHRTDSENSLPEQNSEPESLSGADITDPELQSSNDALALRNVASPQNRGTGRVLVEQWDGIPGKSIDSLKSFKDFPSRPSSRVFLDKLETPKNSADNYGRRIRGYLHVTQPGDYVFYIAGDDESQFFLSTTDKPGDLSRQPIVAISDTEWTALTEWEKYPGQTSAPVHLEAGQRYYFEVLNKEAAGKDGVAVGWKLPDGEVQRPIPGRSLSSFEVDPSYATTTPPAADLLKTLSRQHPRLLGSALDFNRLKENLATQPDFQKFFANIKGVPGRNLPPPINPAARRICNKESAGYKSAEQLLSLPTCTRIMEGIRLLDTSREVLSRVQTLAMSYRLTGEKKFADRAILEMRAVADPAWGDWNPKHFLDTAEMTHALAIGYDWLYDVMSDADQKLIRAAIKTKGLEPSFSEYSRQTFWTSTKGNWNIVCNSGLTLGALTIAEHEPEIATKVIDLALKSTKDSQSVLAWGPDGAHPEGIAYWGYALRYLAAFISGLEYSLGRDVGLGKVEGLSKAGDFPLATFLSGDRYFNYSDVHLNWVVEPSQEMHYLAQRFMRPEFAAFARNYVGVYGLFWYNPEYARSKITADLDQYFRKAEVAVLRSGLSKEDAYVGVKSGDNKAGHSHLDLGSFVYDAKGVRWAVDLGAESYEGAGEDYFKPQHRWTYYRTRPEGQNTLVINPSAEPGQDSQAAAVIDRFKSGTDIAFATTNLTEPYKPSKAQSVRRGFKLFKKTQALMIQDEIKASRPSDVWWFMHINTKATKTTRATEVTVSGSTAVLTNGDKKLVARILSPANANFFLRDASPLPTSPDQPRSDPNKDFKKLSVHLQSVSDGTLTILLTPLNKGEQEATVFPQVVKMKDW